LKETNRGPDTKNPAEGPDFSQNQRWLPFVDAFRTLCRAPGRDLSALFEQIRLFTAADQQSRAFPDLIESLGIPKVLAF
jgi:hypothetical protein